MSFQDFYLYYITRFGFRPSKVAFLADHAWGKKDRGPWPDRCLRTNDLIQSCHHKEMVGGVRVTDSSKISQFKRSGDSRTGPKSPDPEVLCRRVEIGGLRAIERPGVAEGTSRECA